MILGIRPEKNLHQYGQDANMTISHISNVMDHWSKLGLIQRTKKGREMEILLTDKGKEWAKIIQDFDEFSRGVKPKEIKSEEVKDGKKIKG